MCGAFTTALGAAVQWFGSYELLGWAREVSECGDRSLLESLSPAFGTVQ